MAANRLGFWSSVALAGIGAAYVLALAAWFARHGLREPIADPVLAITEVLTLLSAPAVVILMHQALATVRDRDRRQESNLSPSRAPVVV